MKRIIMIVCFCLVLSSAYGQNYVIEKQVIVSGGDFIDSENYQLNGFAGQVAVDDISSGSYQCYLGFWPFALIQGEFYYKYLPGDANMAAGGWQPVVIGGDVTYLVNYFRAISVPCLLDSFYAAADANGDCMVIGSDVTYMVNYFRGANPILYCPDYKTIWPPVPSQQPADWPGCEE